MNEINWSELFTNPLTMAAVGYAVAYGLRLLWETPERRLPAWFPYAVAAVVAVVLYLGGEMLSAEQQAQIIDVFTIVAGVLAAGGVSLVFAKKDTARQDGPAVRDLAPEKPDPRRVWTI